MVLLSLFTELTSEVQESCVRGGEGGVVGETATPIFSLHLFLIK